MEYYPSQEGQEYLPNRLSLIRDVWNEYKNSSYKVELEEKMDELVNNGQ